MIRRVLRSKETVTQIRNRLERPQAEVRGLPIPSPNFIEGESKELNH